MDLQDISTKSESAARAAAAAWSHFAALSPPLPAQQPPPTLNDLKSPESRRRASISAPIAAPQPAAAAPSMLPMRPRSVSNHGRIDAAAPITASAAANAMHAARRIDMDREDADTRSDSPSGTALTAIITDSAAPSTFAAASSTRPHQGAAAPVAVAAPACEPTSESFLDLLRRAEIDGHQPVIINPSSRRPAIPRHDSINFAEMSAYGNIHASSSDDPLAGDAADPDSSVIINAAASAAADAAAAAIDDEEAEGLLAAEQAPYDLLESSMIEDLTAVTRPPFMSSSSSSASISSLASPANASPIESPSMGKLRAVGKSATPIKQSFSLAEEYTSPTGSIVVNMGVSTARHTSTTTTTTTTHFTASAAVSHQQHHATDTSSNTNNNNEDDDDDELYNDYLAAAHSNTTSAMPTNSDHNRPRSVDMSARASAMVTPVKHIGESSSASVTSTEPATQRRAISLAFAQAAVNAARHHTPTHSSQSHHQQQMSHQQMSQQQQQQAQQHSSYEALSEFDPLTSQRRQSVISSRDWMMQFETPSVSGAARAMPTHALPPSGTVGAGRAANGGMAFVMGVSATPQQSLLDVVDTVTTPNSVLKYTQRDMDILKRKLQQNFEKEFELAQLEIQELTLGIENTRIESQRMKDTLVQWEQSVKLMISEKDKDRHQWQQERASLTSQIESLESERDASKRETDQVSLKYKQLRLDMTDLRDVDAKQRARITDLEQSLSIANQRFDSLRQHAESKLDEANVEIARVRASYEKEVSALRARGAQLDVRVQTLEQSLQAKTKESKELTTLCDELVAQMEHMAKST